MNTARKRAERDAEKAQKVLLGATQYMPDGFALVDEEDRLVLYNEPYKALIPQISKCNEPVSISINLSGNSINDHTTLDFIRNQSGESGIQPQRVCFEITETAAIQNFTQASQFIVALKQLGRRFALDDFGSGLSSFACLRELAVDFLKIDGNFVKDIVDDAANQALVVAINQVGHIMGIETIAEYTENDSILELLRDMGVDYAQGYALGKPKPMVLTCDDDTADGLAPSPPPGGG